MTNLLEKIPAPIRSLWKAEVELRRGLWASILDRGQPNPHYERARRHLDEALQSERNPVEKTHWGSADDVPITGEHDLTDDAKLNPNRTARI